ncbi:MAG: hypothetical protein IK071_10765 [Lachnospiraceae bacterium]|nr:hypothetical protein [Lachnospiraceae bacterium]
MDDEEKKYTPILPFNDLAQDHFLIYDNAKYVRDLALTGPVPVIAKHHPAMIKYYTTNCNAEPVAVGGD